MKKYLYMAVAAIAALSSCSSDNDNIIDGVPEPPNPNANAPVFTATIEGEGTRTQLVEGSTAGKLTKVYWSEGDKISINGKVYTTTSTTNVAEFTPEGDAATALGGKYIAVYPSTIVIDHQTATVTLPATQTYDATTNGIGNVPMAAVSTSTSLQFKNVCSVLAIKVASGTVKKIKVMADQKNLSGDFTLDPSTMGIAASSGENYVVLDCGEGVTAENTTFYIAIPPQEYSSLQIYLSADGTTYKEAMATKKAEGLGTLARNKIYPIDYEKNAVQLWAGGPYFATMNVGETTVGGKTAKYAWGATSADGAANAKSNNDADEYDLDHDTAYKIWGSAWRMPTQAEFAYLKTDDKGNCLNGFTLSYSNGLFTFTGKGDYSSAKVSFPGEPLGQFGAIAQYWTSTTVDGDGNVYYGGFELSPGTTSFIIGGNKPIDTNENVLKYFVRAVLREEGQVTVPDPQS